MSSLDSTLLLRNFILEKKIEALCERTREWNRSIKIFFRLCLMLSSMLSGLGNFVVDCEQ